MLRGGFRGSRAGSGAAAGQGGGAPKGPPAPAQHCGCSGQHGAEMCAGGSAACLQENEPTFKNF